MAKPTEYFAETFAYYYLNESTNNTLKAFAPRTHRFMSEVRGKIVEEKQRGEGG